MQSCSLSWETDFFFFLGGMGDRVEHYWDETTFFFCDMVQMKLVGCE